jgi:serine/threonine protein kinase
MTVDETTQDYSPFDSIRIAQDVDEACDRFEAAWRAGDRPRIEDFLDSSTDPSRHVLLRHLLAVELAYRRDLGESPEASEYRCRFPGHDELIDSALAKFDQQLKVVPDTDGVLFGKYKILRDLGEGGLGKVDLVEHIKLETLRALKIIAPALSQDPGWRQRFSREAKALAQLSHPNIVAVHDHAVLPKGDAYIEMEYVRGQSLDKRLQPGVPMDFTLVDHLLGQLCDALQYAHDREIVHRDIKPQNLMVQDGQVPGQEVLKVLDFGIAKILNTSDPSDYVTAVGESLGTPHYMSPEQIKGDLGAVGSKSDIYSVGVILYQLLTGYLPFSGPSRKVYLDHIFTPAPPFSERNPAVQVPPKIEALVLRCLEKEPERRPASARALAEEFHQLVAPPLEPAPSIATGTAVGRRTWLALASGSGLALVLGLLVLSLWPPLTAKPHKLQLVAGDDHFDHVGISLRPDVALLAGCFGTKFKVSVDHPDDIEIMGPNVNKPNYPDFEVRAKLNAVHKSSMLNGELRTGWYHAKLQVPLDIDPPKLAWMPNVFERSDSPLTKLGEEAYPKRIVRRISDHLSVTFLLVEPEPKDPDLKSPFYIMENKVSNDLFVAYLKAKKPGTKLNLTQRQIEWKEAYPEAFGFWPVFNVTVEEAQDFAKWLVPSGGLKFKGDLPTWKQWDKASGSYDRDCLPPNYSKEGPFRIGFSREAGQIAIGKKKPMPIGKASMDISRFGCRDMAGNGLEWTRPESPDPDSRVWLRSQIFDNDEKEPAPFYFGDVENRPRLVRKNTPLEGLDEYIGFRVVIEVN